MRAADLASAGLLDQDGRQLQKLIGSPVNLAWGYPENVAYTDDIGRRSLVQRFRVSFSSLDCIWDGYFEKSVSFVRPNPKFRAKLAIIWESEHF